MVVVPPAAISDSNADTEPPPGHISAPASPRPSPDIIETNIPARLDALPWGRFHVQVVVALGVTWILDGLEVTMAGALSGVLKESATLGLSNAEIGLAASAYLVGAVSGALFFGWLTDRLGRKKLSSSPSSFTSSRPLRRRCPGISGVLRCFAWRPAPA